MQLTSLRRLLIDQLQEVYLSEVLIEQSLGRLQIAANEPALKQAFQQHSVTTQTHIQRLESVFELLSDSPRGGRAASIKALLAEGEDRMATSGDPDVLDASLIACAQQVEHWEIAAYGTARAYALALDQPKVADLLAQSLTEEKQTDAHLSSLADSVNRNARQPA
jgi:ferritin-like metal-binding protein YciE